ncbi:MAG: hypothetical protein CMLOHMNK_00720 [Steroidobacteraceae bacterium]|nr:hypothetical protein [Steroidobacteraceae bacterium]
MTDRRFTTRTKALILAAALCAFAQSATPQATASAYNIEIVVFRAGGSSAEAEGGAGDRAPGGGDSGDTAGGGGVARLIGPLPASSFTLGGVVARLRNAGGYLPIAHAGWSQTPSPWGSRSGFALSRVGVVADGLSGTAWLERGEYLHLGFSMTLGRAKINEIRRVRLGEKNYFDNPDFGVIAVVTAAR